jgi:hypothetical protein
LNIEDIHGGQRIVIYLRNTGVDGSSLLISSIGISGGYFSIGVNYADASFVNYSHQNINYFLTTDSEDYIAVSIDYKPLSQGVSNGVLSILSNNSVVHEYQITAEAIATSNSYSMIMGIPKYEAKMVDGNILGKINYIK